MAFQFAASRKGKAWGGKSDNKDLAQSDNRGKEMYDRLMKQLSEKEKATEQHKAQD